MSTQSKKYCLPQIKYRTPNIKDSKSRNADVGTNSRQNNLTSHERIIDSNACNKKENPDKATYKSKRVRIPFSKEEDETIVRLTKTYGKQWRLISNFVKGRTPKQCRDRYTNYLIPGFFNGEWSKDEDDLLIKLYEE